MQNFKDSRQADFRIAPSILSADFARLGEEVDAVLAAGADMIHFDVMDNHYVPNLTIGPMVCKALRRYGVTAPIDVHLMVEPVDDLIGQFADAGATFITFHPEASRHVDRSLQLIKDRGCFAGQQFIPYVLDKVREARALIDASGYNIRLEVDGGVSTENIRALAAAGADTFVSGSAIFNTDDYAATIAAMRAELALANKG